MRSSLLVFVVDGLETAWGLAWAIAFCLLFAVRRGDLVAENEVWAALEKKREG